MNFRVIQQPLPEPWATYEKNLIRRLDGLRTEFDARAKPIIDELVKLEEHRPPAVHIFLGNDE